MSKYNYDSVRDDDSFPPCRKCGGEDVYLNLVTELYSCVKCGEALLEVGKDTKPPKVVKKKVRLEWK